MKFIVLIVVLFSIYPTHIVSGNPFSSKKDNLNKTVRTKAVSGFVYKGYFFVNNIQHAVVELNGEQQELKVGDKAGRYIITEIKNGYLKYRINGEEHKILIAD